MTEFARLFILIGLVFILVGGLILLFAKINIPIGRLPGDFHFQWGNMTCFVGLGTSILLSILLTIILNIIIRIANK